MSCVIPITIAAILTSKIAMVAGLLSALLIPSNMRVGRGSAVEKFVKRVVSFGNTKMTIMAPIIHMAPTIMAGYTMAPRILEVSFCVRFICNSTCSSAPTKFPDISPAATMLVYIVGNIFG